MARLCIFVANQCSIGSSIAPGAFPGGKAGKGGVGLLCVVYHARHHHWRRAIFQEVDFAHQGRIDVPEAIQQVLTVQATQ